MNYVTASAAKYVKLDVAGGWERLCLKDGTLRLGYYEVPHEAGLSGDADAIRDTYLNEHTS